MWGIQGCLGCLSPFATWKTILPRIVRWKRVCVCVCVSHARTHTCIFVRTLRESQLCARQLSFSPFGDQVNWGQVPMDRHSFLFRGAKQKNIPPSKGPLPHHQPGYTRTQGTPVPTYPDPRWFCTSGGAPVSHRVQSAPSKHLHTPSISRAIPRALHGQEMRAHLLPICRVLHNIHPNSL